MCQVQQCGGHREVSDQRREVRDTHALPQQSPGGERGRSGEYQIQGRGGHYSENFESRRNLSNFSTSSTRPAQAPPENLGTTDIFLATDRSHIRVFWDKNCLLFRLVGPLHHLSRCSCVSWFS